MRTKLDTIFAVALAVLAPTVGAVSAQEAPGGRAHHQLVHHAGESRTYLIGGSTRRGDGHHYFDEVWIWDAGSWTPAPPLPFPRSSHRVVYHEGRGSLILFGGGFARALRAGGVLWELGDGGWRAVGGNDRAATTEPEICYDRHRDRVVLFGGWNRDGDYRGETWEWDGKELSPVETTDAPEPRAGHTLVFDPAGERCLLFGGRGEEGYLADTWGWDGARWQRLDVEGPSPRWFFGTASDPENDRVVLFGGRGPEAPTLGRDRSGDLGDTWTWDGGRWTLLTAEGPPARSSGRMARTRGGVLLFGGRVETPEAFVDRGDTWELRDGTWVRVN